MTKNFILPIGFKHEDSEIKELPIATTGGEAEKVYTTKPSPAKLHEWFARVISVSVESIGGTPIASAYLSKSKDSDRVIPQEVKNIPFIDAGSLLIQIQRECWEDVMENQPIRCMNCGSKLSADIDLKLIDIPTNNEVPTTFDVDLTDDVVTPEMVEALKMYEGQRFNGIRFRPSTLGDAIKHGKIQKDEVLFWQKIATDTLVSLYYKNEDGSKEDVLEGYISKRGSKFFSSDLGSRNLKSIRKGIQTSLPSAKYFYEEECPECSQQTNFFASVSNFFAT